MMNTSSPLLDCQTFSHHRVVDRNLITEPSGAVPTGYPDS
jgi:hypothetical protein